MDNSDSRQAALEQAQAAALPALRHSRLLGLLQERGQATVAELVSALEVSRDTVRRDLDLLDQRGLLIRTRGGALANNRLVQVDTTLGLRMDAHVEAKRQIGRAAASLIRDSETLIINGGSTTCYFAGALGDRRNLTLVTNNLRVPPAVPEASMRAIHILGGVYWNVSQVTLGPVGIPSVLAISADTAVLGVTGLSAEGISVARPEEASIAAGMIGVARRTIILTDASKFGVNAFCKVASFDAIQHLVTNAPPPAEIGEALAQAGVQVLVCSP